MDLSMRLDSYKKGVYTRWKRNEPGSTIFAAVIPSLIFG